MEKDLFLQEADRVSFSDMACLYGFSLFETFYVNMSGKVFLLEEHIQRLCNSSIYFKFELDFTWQEIKNSIINWIEKEGVTHKIVRVSVSFGNRAKSIKPQFFIAVRDYPYETDKLRKGFKLTISSVRRNNTSRIIYHKTGNYLENLMDIESAKAAGYDDVLYLNINGQIAETTKSNIFFIKNQTIFTPSIQCGILAGITRSFVINEATRQKILVEQGEFDLASLLEAEQVFVSNSVFGICPVLSIDNQQYNVSGKEGVFLKLISAYHCQAAKNAELFEN